MSPGRDDEPAGFEPIRRHPRGDGHALNLNAGPLKRKLQNGSGTWKRRRRRQHNPWRLDG